jgi:hypothetical protein
MIGITRSCPSGSHAAANSSTHASAARIDAPDLAASSGERACR